MKTTQLVLISLLFTAFSAFSNNGHETSEHSKMVSASLTVPEALKQTRAPGKIEIHFTVNTQGNVIEVNALTDNREAKKDLEKQFMKLNFKGLPACVSNTIAVRFINY